MPKLTPKQRKEIKKMYEMGIRPKIIMQKYGISAHTLLYTRSDKRKKYMREYRKTDKCKKYRKEYYQRVIKASMS